MAKIRQPPPNGGIAQRIRMAGKAVLSVIFLAGLVVSVAMGWTLIEFVSILGAFLMGRSILQVYFARKNNARMVKALAKEWIEAIYDLAGDDLTNTDIVYFEELLAKVTRLTWIEFRRGILKHRFFKRSKMPRMSQLNRSQKWEAVVQQITSNLAKKGFDSGLRTHANVPSYGVEWKELKKTLISLKKQSLQFTTIWVTPNGKNTKENIEVRRELPLWIAEQKGEVQDWFDGLSAEEQEANRVEYDLRINQWQIIDLLEGDKRGAMATAWLHSFGVYGRQAAEIIQKMFESDQYQPELPAPNCDFSSNVDSDTYLDRDALINMLLGMVIFDLSGVTSNVRIKNIRKTPDFAHKGFFQAIADWLLSELTFWRYDFANNVERNAQSWFWNVVCMSGPFMTIRTSTIPSWLARFVNFVYNGVRMKPGDDRKATYELNRQGRRVGYCSWSVTYTDAPDNWPRWRIQQDRWTMSLFANFFTSLKEGQIFLLSPWSIVDQLYAGGFTFLIMGTVLRVLYNGLVVGWNQGFGVAAGYLLPYFTLTLVINLLRGGYAAWDNKNLKGFIMCLYIFVVIKELIPIKFIRLFIKGIAERMYEWGGRSVAT